MITALIAFLMLERIAKYTGIEPKVLVWIKEKLKRRNQPKAKLKEGIEVMGFKNKEAA
ncbi:hypothetical protein HQ489_03970 [Candidatus Woesearchaeota archaeon]|nr:hypothetical protein [Candidatus Woesearchaeota archaeon]